MVHLVCRSRYRLVRGRRRHPRDGDRVARAEPPEAGAGEPDTDGRLMAAPSVVRSGDWSVAIVAGIVVLALYWLVVGGDIPRVN